MLRHAPGRARTCNPMIRSHILTAVHLPILKVRHANQENDVTCARAFDRHSAQPASCMIGSAQRDFQLSRAAPFASNIALRQVEASFNRAARFP